jgi:hypothetical protein
MIEVSVRRKSNGEWQKIAVLQEEDIFVETESIDTTLARFVASRESGIPMEFNTGKRFSELVLEEKRKLICQLRPLGLYRLVVCSGIGKDPRFEAVHRISFCILTEKAALPVKEPTTVSVKEPTMDPVFIGYYLYAHGFCDSMNRKLEFYEINDQAIEVRLNVRVEHEWKEHVQIISEDNICAEAESMTQKIEKCLEAGRLGQEAEFLPRKGFPALTFEEKKHLIRQLEPEGPYRIEVTNIFSPVAEHEHVEKIRFYNPH